MKYHKGTSSPCSSLKSLSNKVGILFCRRKLLPSRYKGLDTKLERKIMEVKKGLPGNGNFQSIDSMILKFPQFKEGLRDIKAVFEQYDEDSNGTIGRHELKICLEKLQVHLTEKEVDELYCSCDMDGREGIQFKEFIVLLCLTHLLKTTKVGSPQLEATFETMIEAFLFLDKNGDGKLNKRDMVKALNEASPRERSPAHVTMTRFREMDWDGNGEVSFREFLYAFIDWVGLDNEDEVMAHEIKEEEVRIQ